MIFKIIFKVLNYNNKIIFVIFIKKTSWFYFCFDNEEEKMITFSRWKSFTQFTQSGASTSDLELYFAHGHPSTLLYSIKPVSSKNIHMLKNSRYFLPIIEEQIYSNQENLEKFIHFRHFSFISFFINNMIDVPVCFRKTVSLRRRIFELPILKFSNVLMKKGQREQITKIVIYSFFKFFNELRKEKSKNFGEWFNWFETYNVLTNIFVKSRFLNNFNITDVHELFYPHTLNLKGKNVNLNISAKNYLYDKLAQVPSIFTFFIYNVDKNIRKYSRGKSGKYVFVWKYIAPYKRFYVALRWILKDIKFNHNNKISERIVDIFLKLTEDPKNSFIWRSHLFAYTYVFRNLKKTLMTTLKTTV